VHTGLPGDALPNVATTKKFPAGLEVEEPWFVVEAQADADKDGDFCRIVASSLNDDLVVENEGE
jgi:hypothetical protein